MTMPRTRLIGNAGLSFMAKFSTGYWNSFDPTNGFFAIHASLMRLLPIEKISQTIFFRIGPAFPPERDRSAGRRYPHARALCRRTEQYAAAQGNPGGSRRAMLKNFIKRIFYRYFLRDFSIASIELAPRLGLACCSGQFSGWRTGDADSFRQVAGTVMLAAMPIIIGTQFLLAFLNYDIQSVPSMALHPRLEIPGHNVRCEISILQKRTRGGRIAPSEPSGVRQWERCRGF